MKMVVASFESMVGLSTAAPYMSVALKTVSRHFRSLKQVISEQLRHMGRTLREELSSPTAGTSSIKCNASTSGLRLSEHQKQKSCGSAMILFEPHQPVWGPQRGLPERAVAVLRAWMFDHFLHPYPTDTNKHMLATQTGLTRNQAFFVEHPEFVKNDFFITGESYAGHYIPAFAARVYQGNKAKEGIYVNLKFKLSSRNSTEVGS